MGAWKEKFLLSQIGVSFFVVFFCSMLVFSRSVMSDSMLPFGL